MNRHEMTRKYGTLASLVALLVGFLGCSVDSPTAPDQVPAPPPTVGGNNWSISVTVTPDELVAGSDAPATIEVDVASREDGSNPPNGTTMTVSTSLGELGASGSGAQSLAVTTFRGKASALLFAGQVATTGTVSARLEGSVGSDGFQVLSDVNPFILGVTPNEGPESGGTLVTITGAGFSQNTRVFFGNWLGSVTSLTSDKITVITPPADNPGELCDAGAGTDNGTVKQDLPVAITLESANGGRESLANAFIYRTANPGVCVQN
jgi:hypothetical protein